MPPDISVPDLPSAWATGAHCDSGAGAADAADSNETAAIHIAKPSLRMGASWFSFLRKETRKRDRRYAGCAKSASPPPMSKSLSFGKRCKGSISLGVTAGKGRKGAKRHACAKQEC